MRTFDEIYAIAAERKGGVDTLEASLPKLTDPVDLAEKPSSAWLEQMTKSIFQAGFNWKVVDDKWPNFLAACRNFDVHACAMMDDEWFDALMADKAIIRNGPKLRTIAENAQFILDQEKQGPTFSQMVANWPDEDFIGLLDLFKSKGARLGGMTGPYTLRFMGKDGFILSRDVVARLIAEGIVDKAPSSKRDKAAVQQAFTHWKNQSSRSFTQDRKSVV